MTAEPLADGWPRAARRAHSGLYRISECAVAIVGRSLDAREPLAPRSSAECVEPASGSDEHDDGDEYERENGEQHASRTGPGDEPHEATPTARSPPHGRPAPTARPGRAMRR